MKKKRSIAAPNECCLLCIPCIPSAPTARAVPSLAKSRTESDQVDRVGFLREPRSCRRRLIQGAIGPRGSVMADRSDPSSYLNQMPVIGSHTDDPSPRPRRIPAHRTDQPSTARPLKRAGRALRCPRFDRPSIEARARPRSLECLECPFLRPDPQSSARWMRCPSDWVLMVASLGAVECALRSAWVDSPIVCSSSLVGAGLRWVCSDCASIRLN